MEVRWGELLGKAKPGRPTTAELWIADQERKSDAAGKVSRETLSNAQKQQRKTLRKLAENKETVLDAIDRAQDAQRK